MATPSHETKRPKRMREGNYLPTPVEEEHIKALKAKLLQQEDFKIFHAGCNDFRKEMVAQVVAESLVICQRLLQLESDIRCVFYWDNRKFPDDGIIYGEASGDPDNLYIGLNTFSYFDLFFHP